MKEEILKIMSDLLIHYTTPVLVIKNEKTKSSIEKSIKNLSTLQINEDDETNIIYKWTNNEARVLFHKLSEDLAYLNEQLKYNAIHGV